MQGFVLCTQLSIRGFVLDFDTVLQILKYNWTKQSGPSKMIALFPVTFLPINPSGNCWRSPQLHHLLFGLPVLVWFFLLFGLKRRMQIIILGAWCWVGVVVDANQLFGHCQLIMIDDFDNSQFDENPVFKHLYLQCWWK